MVSYIVQIGNVRWNWLNEVLRYIATNMQKIDVLSNVKTLNLPKFLKNLNGPHLCFVPWLQGFQHFRVVQWTRGFHTEPPCDAARMEEMGTGQATDQISRDHRLTTDSAGLGFSQILPGERVWNIIAIGIKLETSKKTLTHTPTNTQSYQHAGPVKKVENTNQPHCTPVLTHL